MTDRTSDRCAAREPNAAWHRCTKARGHAGDHLMAMGPLPWPVWDNLDDQADVNEGRAG